MKMQTNQFFYLNGLKVFIILIMLIINLSVVYAQKWEIIADKPVPKNLGFHGVSVVDDNIVWMAANDYPIWGYSNGNPDHTIRVVKTIDGGKNWQHFDVVEAKGRITYEIFAIDSLTAWITTNKFDNTDKTPIFKTTDGGRTWRQIEIASFAGGNIIHFFNSQEGIVINGSNVALSNDGGETWFSNTGMKYALKQNELLYLYSSSTSKAAFSDSIVVVGTNMGRIFFSKDRGQNWQTKQVGTVNDVMTAITMLNDNHWIAISPGSRSQGDYVNSKVFQSYNGGSTWSESERSKYSIFHIARLPGSTNTIFTGSFNDAGIKMSTSGFDMPTWLETLDQQLYCYGIAFSPNGTGYAVCFDDAEENFILKWNNVPSNTDENAQVASDFLLFPNPTAGTLEIPNPLTVHRNITIIDARGALVLKFLNTTISEFNIAHLSNGVYVVMVESEGSNKIGRVIKAN